MFVDDSLYVHIKQVIRHSMAVSIEALHMVIGYPDITARQDALSLDKFLQSICSYQCEQLGVLINTRSMTIGLAEQKRLVMIDELTHWHKSRRSFTLLQVVILCGTLEYWSNTSRWGRFLFLSLRDSVTSALHRASAITKDRKVIKLMISELARRPSTANFRSRFFHRYIAKEIYKCKAVAHINRSMKTELKIINKILMNPTLYNLTTPIAHLVTRDPNFLAYSDACLETSRAQVPTLEFWWHIEWPSAIKSSTLKKLRVTRRCPLTHKLISTNLLEYVAEIFTYAAVTVFFSLNRKVCLHPHPLLIIYTDNMSAKF